MSYCRFGEGDVYLYASVLGGLECCACWLAPTVVSIFTTGRPEFNIPSCAQCDGLGCEVCMMHPTHHLATVQDAYTHLVAHRLAGHHVPQDAIDALISEGATP